MKKALELAVLLVALAGGTGMCQQASSPSSTPREVLKSSTDRDALEHAARTLARSGDAGDLALLGQMLHQREFLARLDDLSKPESLHLGRVIAALAEHPTPQAVELCLSLAEDPVFVAEADRKSFVLELLASVKPMAERTAAVLQRSNAEGYFEFNARLLAANGSPRALGLFESMMLDKTVPVENRVECLHVSFLPRRMQPEILRSADQILSKTSERNLANGVIESVFDFRQQWFGIESGISEPPPWTSASPDSLRAALQLANKAEARPGLSPSLHKKVASARETIAQALGQH
jgi:hypothetical protein